MKSSKNFRCAVSATMVFIMLLVSTLCVPISIVFPAEAGQFGDIVPTTYELQLLDKINENRTDNGAGVLKFNASLWWVARAHSQDMIDHDFFDHDSSVEGPFEGASFSQRVRNYAEYENGYIGECIAWNSWGIDVEWCMAAWKDSAPHWNIIIDPNFREIGLGVLQGEWDGVPDAGLYTADFGGASLSVDLAVSEVDIDFNPSLPFEGQEVNISADIHNLGSTDAYPVKVKFYDGDPDSGGSQIGQEQQIMHILVHDESAIVTVSWDTTGKSGNHDIYVVVDRDDIIGETNEGNNKAFKSLFVNSSGSPPDPPIHLNYGWNLVSFPQEVMDTDLEFVLSTIDGKYDSVLAYNPSDAYDSWKYHHVSKPSLMNDLHDLDNTIGFWINIVDSGGADLTVDGDVPTTPQYISLERGWNLVGYPSTAERPRDDALNNLDFGIEIDEIQYYDNATGTIKNLEAGHNIEPGKGYWMYAAQDCVWTVNS